MKLSTILCEYASQSSIHGVAYLGRRDVGTVAKFIWVRCKQAKCEL